MHDESTQDPDERWRARDPHRDDYQRALVAGYQEALAEAGGDRTKVPEAAREMLAALLADVEALLRCTVGDHLNRRFAGRVPADLAEEVLGEAQVAVIEAAAAYDGRKRFVSWLIDPRGGPATTAIRATVSTLARHVPLNQTQERAVAYARRAWADLRTEGREPSADDICDEARARCMRWAIERVHDAWARDGRAPGDGPDTSEQIAAELAQAKLVRSGMWKALGQIWDLLAVADPAVLYDPTAPGVADTVPARDPDLAEETEPGASPVAAVAVCGLPPADQELVWSHLFADVDDPARAVGEDGQTPERARAGRTAVAEILRAAQGRLKAPHAHFAALSVTLDSQFEVSGDPSLVDRLAAACAQTA